jgi:hypothetical protein
MRISDARLEYIIQNIAADCERAGIVESGCEVATLAKIRKAFMIYEEKRESIDDKVRLKIASLKRDVPVASREWSVLYRQYFEEEMVKLG